MKFGFVFVIVALACGPFIEEDTVYAHDAEGPRCRITITHCSDEEVLSRVCGVDQQPTDDDGRSVTTTTTVDSDATTTTTLAPTACPTNDDGFTYSCIHDTGTRGFRCRIQRADGSIEHCRRYVTKKGERGPEKKFKGCSFVAQVN